MPNEVIDKRQFKTAFDHEAVVAKKLFMPICTDDKGEIYISRTALIEWLSLDDSTLGPRSATARLMQLLHDVKDEHNDAMAREVDRSGDVKEKTQTVQPT